MEIARRRRPHLAMDMSPMIDCVFQLLIFFMLSSTFLTPALKLDLPTASNDAPPEAPEVMITLDKEGKIYLNNQPVTIEVLKADLPGKVAASKRKTITIRGDEAMDYKHFVEVLDVAAGANASNVLVQHETD